MHNFIRQRTNYKPHLVNCLQVTPRSASDKARLCCAAIFIHQLHNQLNSIPVKAALPLCQSTKNHEKKLQQLFLGVLHFFSVSWAQMGHNKLGKTDSRRLSLAGLVAGDAHAVRLPIELMARRGESHDFLVECHKLLECGQSRAVECFS